MTLCLQNILSKKVQKFITCLLKDNFMSFKLSPISFPKCFLALVLQDVLAFISPYTSQLYTPSALLLPIWRVPAFLISPCEIITLLCQSFWLVSSGHFPAPLFYSSGAEPGTVPSTQDVDTSFSHRSKMSVLFTVLFLLKPTTSLAFYHLQRIKPRIPGNPW